MEKEQRSGPSPNCQVSKTTNISKTKAAQWGQMTWPFVWPVAGSVLILTAVFHVGPSLKADASAIKP